MSSARNETNSLGSRPNFSAMQSQALFRPAGQGGVINPFMTIGFCSVSDELNHLQTNSSKYEFDIPRFAPQYTVLNELVELRNSSELAYALPPNTTLVEVLGPCRPGSEYGNQCYATLNPRPAWWTEGNFPTSSSHKLVNQTNQTLFLLPIDPEIKFELRVGALGIHQICPIGGIRTYPFH